MTELRSQVNIYMATFGIDSKHLAPEFRYILLPKAAQLWWKKQFQVFKAGNSEFLDIGLRLTVPGLYLEQPKFDLPSFPSVSGL